MEDKVKPKVSKYKFKAEMQQLLNLIVHSLYKNPEVFLRELISNSSDALNKVRFHRLTDSNIVDPEAELDIRITLDKENQTFSIEDTGIGMSKEELISQIGTVASSGTLEFLNKIQEEKKTLDASIIGQFGVGFYSVFMVSDFITIETRRADTDSKAWRWTSDGQENFKIKEIDRKKRGTKITFKLKDDSKNFANAFDIKSILKKYSNFVDFPIFVDDEKVNMVSALWHKKKDSLKDDELEEFYKFITNDFNKHLAHLHISIEGNINFKALLFIPESAPPNLFTEFNDKNLHLYTNKIFIQDDAKELLPDYLRFIKGVVDTEDLPLNVSREVTQSSPVMTKIRNVLTGKVLSLLEDMAENEKENYKKFYSNFSPLFKTGLNSDFTNKDKIVELLRFESSKHSKGELTSLKDYVFKMRDDQKDIFYITGDSRESLEQNPNLEYFRKNEIEVLFLTDPVDLFILPYMAEYDKKSLKSIERVDLDLNKDENEEESLSNDLTKSLLELFKDTLKDKVEDVIESKRLVESPATLVIGKEGLDPQMEKMMQMLDKTHSSSTRILEINTKHDLIKNLSKLHLENSNDPVLTNCIIQLYEGAMLIEGHLKTPTEYVSRMNEIMIKATNT